MRSVGEKNAKLNRKNITGSYDGGGPLGGCPDTLLVEGRWDEVEERGCLKTIKISLSCNCQSYRRNNCVPPDHNFAAEVAMAEETLVALKADQTHQLKRAFANQ